MTEHRDTGGDVMFGDAEDIDFLEVLPLATTPRVVSTIPSTPATTALLHALGHHDDDGLVAVTALHERDAVRYQALGADVVLRPFTIAAEATCQLLGVSTETETASAPRGARPP